MKALITLITAITLVGCSVESTSPDTMAPLPTTGANATIDTTPPVVRLSDYFSFIHQRVTVSVNHNTLVDYAEIWCDFMERGMSKSNVVAWITEMASDQAEMDLWLASAESSAYYYCPSQAYRWNP